MVMRDWAAITAVAQVLLKRKPLTGAEIRCIVAESDQKERKS